MHNRFEEYIEKGGQRLRLGYTTGSCAAAAAKAAAMMLLSGREIRHVRLMTPKGIELVLEIEDIRKETGKRPFVSCAVRKDSGDDPDITNGALVCAAVALSDTPGIRIDGGEGVGRVTKPGLDQPVGSAAINSTPRRMIEAAVREAMEICGGVCRQKNGEQTSAAPLWNGESFPVSKSDKEPSPVTKGDKEPSPVTEEPSPVTGFGLDVTIFVPRGQELAEKTFNPKLGIVGGISILGTSGIVEPMSDRALLDTIRAEISVRRSEGLSILAAAPGNYGKNFFMEKYGFSLETAVTASNFIYDTVQMASQAGFTRMLFVGHIGKLVKVAGGIRNTHSQYGDRRMEILGQIAEDVAGDGSTLFYDDNGRKNDDNAREDHNNSRKKEIVLQTLKQKLAECVSTDEAIRILQKYDLDQPVLAEMTHRIKSVMEGWTEGKMQAEVIVFSNVFGELGKTPQAEDYIRELRLFIAGGCI